MDNVVRTGLSFERMLPLALIMLTAACSSMPGQNVDRDYMRGRGETLRGAETTDRSSQQGSAEDNRAVHSDLIRSMLLQGQYYAALAHVEDQKRISGDSRELRYLEAEAKRSLGKNADALRLYNGLLKSEFDGEAHHGLGLMAFKTDPAGAVQHLRIAVQRRPTDAQFRNDLGFALMESGIYKEALMQLATAVELDSSNTKARNNLIVLLMVSGDESRAKQVAQESGINEQAYAGLRARAQDLSQSKARAGKGVIR